jgi:hypothetical protein
MKLWKLLLIGMLATSAIYGSVIYFMWSVASEIDNNGGVKSIVERIWNGKEETQFIGGKK